jgi:predicted helicase
LRSGRAHPIINPPDAVTDGRRKDGEGAGMATAWKGSSKAIGAYYKRLRAFEDQGVGHELAVRSAFQDLLAEAGKSRGWTLIPELALKVGGKLVRPDATLRDEWHLPRGYWEAKDSADVLDDEVRKKIDRGYPLVNTIFEDSRRGVLFQNGREALRADLRQPDDLARLLKTFLDHTEPDVEGFENAVREFQERIPHLAKALLEKIQAAHKTNTKFQGAFDSLLELCRTSLNPNISVAAVDEMLVQHLMTERLFDRIFRDQDLARRNVIAAEIETVIDALVSQSFNRSEFLKSLDPFYKAIEDAARTIDDFSEKQHFLNSVYERFFQGYSVKVADTHGIVYTPQEIVDFMCASVQEVLRSEFSLGLASPGVNILDPCTGTGNFIVNLMRRVERRDLPRFYRDQLFANEVMLLPYYIAAQNIEHEYYDRTGTYEPFGGLCFVDTLELAEAEQGVLSFMSEENTARVVRQKKTPINVIIGNPPYNVGQLNENDNNKNRKYKVIDKRVGDTFASDSTATNKNSLSDVYVKFYRWAIDRLQGRDGVICFVSNNGFLRGIAFDGFREHLAQEFDRIYQFNVRGNGRALGMQRTLEGRNVFNDSVRVGVGITLLIRHRATRSAGGCVIHYHAVGDRMKTREKLAYIKKFTSIADVPWEVLTPDARHSWLVPENADEYAGMLVIGSKGGKLGLEEETVFKTFSAGVKTNRDEVVYYYSASTLASRTRQFVEDYNGEVDRYKRSDGSIEIDDFVRYDRIKWSRDLKADLKRGNYAQFNESKIRTSLYRPFCKKYLFFDRILNQDIHVFPRIFPDAEAEIHNRLICVSDIGFRAFGFCCLITNCIADLHLCAASDAHQCFPFYVYDEDGTNRRENITDWALGRFRAHYNDPAITKWDIFHYVYGVLHQPAYRERFADNLRRELPRIPLLDDFAAVAAIGRELAEWHVNYEAVEPYPLTWKYAEGVPLSYRVEKMRLSKDKTSLVVNPSLTLADIPADVFRYRLGNRSALE